MKKGIKITAKIVLMTLFPLIFISVVAVLMGASGEKKIAYQLMEENLHNVAYDVYSLSIIPSFSVNILSKSAK